MRMGPLRTALVLYLTAFFSAELQVFSFSLEGLFSSTKTVRLDNATNSFDDQYNGCVDSTEDKMRVVYHSEIASTVYAKAWETATAKWNEKRPSVSVPQGFETDYAIATLAYTQKETNWCTNLNNAVREGGKSEDYYLKNFHFKAFHFYLTRAIQVLQANSPKCRTTYRGVRGIRFTAKPSEKVRFGRFASSSLDKRQAMNFGRDTLFTITTCFGAYIKDFSFYPEEEEVLIPPFEMFKVVDSIENQNGIEITLASDRKASKYNCVYAKGAGVSRLYASAWMPFLLWGLLLTAGTLRGPGFL